MNVCHESASSSAEAAAHRRLVAHAAAKDATDGFRLRELETKRRMGDRLGSSHNP
jgi:hypothetical protein